MVLRISRPKMSHTEIAAIYRAASEGGFKNSKGLRLCMYHVRVVSIVGGLGLVESRRQKERRRSLFAQCYHFSNFQARFSIIEGSSSMQKYDLAFFFIFINKSSIFLECFSF